MELKQQHPNAQNLRFSLDEINYPKDTRTISVNNWGTKSQLTLQIDRAVLKCENCDR